MSISQRQFDQLTEMGISLWQKKTLADEHTPSTTVNNQKTDNFLEQNDTILASITELKLFHDILRLLEISVGEVHHKNDHLDLGLFNWYFYAQDHTQPSINCKKNNLFSPSLQQIKESPELKKQLWLTIMNNLI